jgi:predicted oxidoreductase
MDGSQQSSLDGMGTTLDGTSLTADGSLLHSTFAAGGQRGRGGSQYRAGHIKALDMSVVNDKEEVTF